LDMSRCRTNTKRSMMAHANAPGSGDSRSDITNPRLCAKHKTQGPSSGEGLRG
jgi:hypothetical protein